MTDAWKPYACTVPARGVTGTCTVLSTVHHVTHTGLALRILADGKITRGLIYDESILNDTRTTVVWLSPNSWYDGSRYGCVQFTFDFADIVARRKIYWVEVRKYKRDAYRFILSDQDLSKLPVTPYDPTTEEGPLRHVNGLWYWNSVHTAEFMLELQPTSPLLQEDRLHLTSRKILRRSGWVRGTWKRRHQGRWKGAGLSSLQRASRL